MREIIAGRLWIGNAHDIRPWRNSDDVPIRAIVDLAAEEPAAQVARDLMYYRVPLIDGGGNTSQFLELAITTTMFLIVKNVRTMVCCGAGMSRAPAICAAALRDVKQQNLNDVLDQYFQTIPHDISPALWSHIRSIAGED